MSTKVKGDKIKEGSIPLSALSSGDNLLAGLVGDDSSFIAMTEDNVNYDPRTSEKTVYIYITTRNRMVELSKYNKVTIVDGPPAELIWDNNGVRITGFASYYNPIMYFKLKAPTPNWNAQEGEAGYIENKPFEKIIFDGIIERDNLIVYNYYTNDSSVYISLEGTEILQFEEYGAEQEITLDLPAIEIYWNGVDQVYITNLSDKPIDIIKNYISVYGYNRRLLSSSIDDGVIKTFPQTLSDDAKNQVLSNLGIDPVVWKYMMNPYGITPGQPIPEDLANIIYDEEEGFLPIIKNVCYIKEDTDAVYYHYITRVCLGDDSIYTQIRGSEDQYDYNYNNRIFTYSD